MLPDDPDTWSGDELGYRQRWLAGAFGRLRSIANVEGYRVIRDAWGSGADGVAERTILEAEIIEEPAS